MAGSNVPRQYVWNVCGTGLASSSDVLPGGFGVVLPFDAQQLAISNDGATPVYVDLTSSAVSTGGYKLPANTSITISGIRTFCFSVGSTTTTTGTEVCRGGAWAW